MSVSMGAVMLAYGDEPYLDGAVASVMGSRGVAVDLVVVDNGCTRTDLAELCAAHGARLVGSGSNLGFAAGVNFGAGLVSGDYLALVNSDAEVAEDALAALAEVAGAPGIGIATASVRLANEPTLLNSAGNPVHFLGLSWAGALGERADEHAEPCDVASASGAGLVLTRALWDELAGFPAEFFAYQEDLELSWRTWQRGLRVRYVPGAVVLHHYEFARNPLKMYLLERNRLLFVLTCYGGRTLALLAPVLVGFELAMLVVAAIQGWAGAKLRGWRWVLTHRAWVKQRRRLVQSGRRVPDRDLQSLWASRFTATAMPLPSWAGPAQSLLAGYWRLVRPLL